jgi:hypothetical protein
MSLSVLSANVFGPDGVEINLNTDLATMTGPWENFLRAMGWLAIQFGVKAVRWLFCVVVTNKAYDCLPKVCLSVLLDE